MFTSISFLFRKILEFFTLSVFLTVCSKTFVFSSVADPERFDADLDPTFQADADPDAAPDTNFFT